MKRTIAPTAGRRWMEVVMRDDIMISAHGLAPRYIGECVRCGKPALKKAMITLYVRQSGYQNIKTLCHVCRECMTTVLDELGVGMP